MSSKYINDLRDKCKNKSDHDFVDAMEHIITEYEKPRDPIDLLNVIPGSEFEKDWNEAIKKLIENK